MEKNKNNVSVFSLCCGKAKCPTVSVKDQEWSISDDFGGQVKLTKEQVQEFITKAKTVIND